MEMTVRTIMDVLAVRQFAIAIVKALFMHLRHNRPFYDAKAQHVSSIFNLFYGCLCVGKSFQIMVITAIINNNLLYLFLFFSFPIVMMR